MSDKLDVLEGIKLVPDENIMPEVPTYVRLLDVIDEGIHSSFGMRQKDSMILRLTFDLRAALIKVEQADALERKVKGLQLELGRVKKRLEKQGVQDPQNAT